MLAMHNCKYSLLGSMSVFKSQNPVSQQQLLLGQSLILNSKHRFATTYTNTNAPLTEF